MEWEKSMMSGEMSFTSIEEAEANEEDEEIRQNGMQNIKGKEPKQVYSWRKQTTNEAFVVIELGERVSDQQAQIDQMRQQMSQQSEQSRPYFQCSWHICLLTMNSCYQFPSLWLA